MNIDADYIVNPSDTRKFIDTLYGNMTEGVLEVTCLAPKGVSLRPRTVVYFAPLPITDIDMQASNIAKLNARGYGIYFGVGVRTHALPRERRISKQTGKPYMMQPRGGKEHVLCLPALYAEIDNPSTDAISDLYWKVAIPSIVVRSGGGWHGYWLLNEPLYVTDENRATVDRMLRGLARAVGADMHSAELARILRLPGTVNTKPDRGAIKCEVVAHYGNRYHIDELYNMIHRYMPRELPTPTRVIPHEAATGLPAWVLRYIETGATQGERNVTLYKAAREYCNAGLPQMICEQEAGARAAADGLDDDEIARTIESAYRKDRQPNVPTSARQRMSFGDVVRRLRGHSA